MNNYDLLDVYRLKHKSMDDQYFVVVDGKLARTKLYDCVTSQGNSVWFDWFFLGYCEFFGNLANPDVDVSWMSTDFYEKVQEFSK